MKPTETAEKLINALYSDPAKFERDGAAYDLLQAYFGCAPLDTLRPLLSSANPLLVRPAIYVASELGSQAASLLNEITPVLDHEDPYLRHLALDCVAIATTGERAREYLRVLLALEDPDSRVREHAMFLMSNAREEKLAVVSGLLTSGDDSLDRHRVWLRALVDPQPDVRAILDLLHSSEPLARRYGAIAAVRLHQRFPGLVVEIAESAGEDDTDIRSFLEHKQLQGGG